MEKGGVLFGQHACQPVSHAHQQMFAALPTLKFALPKWMLGEDRLGAAGKLHRIIFRDVRAEIIPRLAQNEPRDVSWAMARLPFKAAHDDLFLFRFNLHFQPVYAGRMDRGCPSQLELHVPAFFIQRGDYSPHLRRFYFFGLTLQESCQILRVHHVHAKIAPFRLFHKPAGQNHQRENFHRLAGFIPQIIREPCGIALGLFNRLGVFATRKLQRLTVKNHFMRGLSFMAVTLVPRA
jgi:hypothetical protein